MQPTRPQEDQGNQERQGNMESTEKRESRGNVETEITWSSGPVLTAQLQEQYDIITLPRHLEHYSVCGTVISYSTS